MASSGSDKRSFWGNIKSEILNNLQRDRVEHQVYCDVTIETTNGKIKAHKPVLGSSSQYFHNMFKAKMTESSTGVVELKHLNPESVKVVVNYIYESEIDLSMENVFGILHCADYMQLNELKGFCRFFLLENINGSSCLSIRSCAQTFRLEDVLAKAQDFVVDNLATIKKNKEFLDLSVDDLFNLFNQRSSKTLESEVFEGLMHWIKHQSEEREEFFPRLMSVVNLTKLTPAYIASNVTTEPLVQESMSCMNQVLKAYEFHQGLKTEMASVDEQRLSEELENERMAVDSLTDAKMDAGDVQMIVDAKWFGRWKKYVTRKVGTSPGPIDNSALCNDKECTQLKEDLTIYEDYVLFPIEAWNYLTERHGCVATQTQISFPVIAHEDSKGEDIRVVDLYSSERSISLRFYNIKSPNNREKATFPCSQTIAEVKDEICQMLKVGNAAAMSSAMRYVHLLQPRVVAGHPPRSYHDQSFNPVPSYRPQPQMVPVPSADERSRSYSPAQPLSSSYRPAAQQQFQSVVIQGGAGHLSKIRRENGEILTDDVTLGQSGLKNGDVLVYNPHF